MASKLIIQTLRHLDGLAQPPKLRHKAEKKVHKSFAGALLTIIGLASVIAFLSDKLVVLWDPV